MEGYGDVVEQMVEGIEDCDVVLIEVVVDVVVCYIGKESFWEENNEKGGYSVVIDVIVFFDLGMLVVILNFYRVLGCLFYVWEESLLVCQ